MKTFNQSCLYRFYANNKVASILTVLFILTAFLSCSVGEQAVAAPPADDDDSDDWMFDKSLYTNDAKTGKRVDQYKKEKTPYRDPNAWFDSPMGVSPFFNDFYGGFYGYSNPFFYLEMWPEYYSQFYKGNDGSEYYPYDGDPNYDENNDQ